MLTLTTFPMNRYPRRTTVSINRGIKFQYARTSGCSHESSPICGHTALRSSAVVTKRPGMLPSRPDRKSFDGRSLIVVPPQLLVEHIQTERGKKREFPTARGTLPFDSPFSETQRKIYTN